VSGGWSATDGWGFFQASLVEATLDLASRTADTLSCMDVRCAAARATPWWERYWLAMSIVGALVVVLVLFVGWLSATTAENCEAARDAPWQCAWFWQEAAPEAIVAVLALAGLLVVFGVARAWRRRRPG
jgi:hypothetical protein